MNEATVRGFMESAKKRDSKEWAYEDMRRVLKTFAMLIRDNYKRKSYQKLAREIVDLDMEIFCKWEFPNDNPRK